MRAQGNHDIALDSEFYSQYGATFHNQNPQVPEECIQLLRQSPSIVYLENEAANIRLCKDPGPGTQFRIFGSPHSPRLRTWAFQYDAEEAESIWSRIPLDADVVVTHTPPRYHCDKWQNNEGCEELRKTLWRVRPRLAVCGHIHNSRGAERVRWDLSNSNVRFKETSTGYWQDPTVGTKKQALLDLSSRGGDPLQNDGSSATATDDVAILQQPEKIQPTHGMAHATSLPCLSRTRDQTPALGQGGDPRSGRSDSEALQGREGRLETCIVNAAIMASSYPYTGNAGQRYNKPIVIDIDLPVWRS